ncbi:hypothetical protein ZWY2020_026244 [Hordeum vulgare]|nr:hypothetical protein ZWY2020_026244 [Hordeum vulgare]
MAAPAPVPAQLRRCPCSAPLWTLSIDCILDRWPFQQLTNRVVERQFQHYRKVIAESLSEEEIAGLKEMFQTMDADNSGAITYDMMSSKKA